jgi:hypothetical protein
MAVLNTDQRRKIWEKVMHEGHFPGDINKADLLAAIDAVDDFLEANIVAINNSFPLPYRTSASLSHKAILVGLIALRRAGII